MYSNRLSSLLALSILGAVLEAKHSQRAKAAPSKDDAANPGTDKAAPSQNAAPCAESIADFVREKFGLHDLDRAAATAVGASPMRVSSKPSGPCECADCASDVKVVDMTLPIPSEIAEAAGMNAQNFDVYSSSGRVITLMAAVRTQLEALAATAPDSDQKARLLASSMNTQAAIDVLQYRPGGAATGEKSPPPEAGRT